MSYLVFCTFDLKSASSKDYEDAYADLKAVGLVKVHEGSSGTQVVIPTTAAMGTFNGKDAATVRDDIRAAVKSAFTKRGFKSEIFLVVGGDWGWGAATT